MKNSQNSSVYEFASFRLDVKNCRLTHGDDETIPLTPKEFDILLLLIENGGRIVKKDELLETIWNDAFVEEATLTRNISWLRQKLAANGANDAKIIETIPKRGYRFLPAIRKSGEDALIIEEQTIQHIQIEEIIEMNPPDAFDSSPKALPAPPKKFSQLWIIPVCLIFAALAFFAYRGYVAGNYPKISLATKIAPFAGLPGREDFPAFSPDGKQMVFSWDGGVENGKMNIYVKLIGAGEPVRLTTSDADEITPVFSPDGKSIAFVRVFPEHCELVLIPALGGAERVIYDRASYASVSFSPDGKLIAAAELDAANNQAGIFTINLQTGERTRLTAPENPAVDHTPRFSPDGKSLAFIRYFSSFRREIFVVPASGGEARQITFDDVRIFGLAWNPDSRNLFFTSFRVNNQLNMWQISAEAKAEPQMISTGSNNLKYLAISPDGKTIAFVEETADENIWEIAPNSAPRPVIRSSRADHSPQISPDGRQIVFVSERTGNLEIWIADADGRNQRQLTDSKSSAGSPRFSPDGKQIVFDAQTAGSSDVYVISANGGAPVQLTNDDYANALPAWSADGKWIFFLSNRAGGEQIWKMPASGGDAVQITRQGAFEAFAAPDGKTIIYSKGAGKNGLWSVGADGADEKPIPELSEAGGWRSWSVTSKGIYYTAFAAQIPLHIKFYDFATGRTVEIAAVDKLPLAYYANLTASDDGKRILYARQDQTNASIMLAELADVR